MSTKTKNWTEADFRKELKRLDDYVEKTQGIKLNGGDLPIEYIPKSSITLGEYYPYLKKFKFTLSFFNSDVPESVAIDVIRHEYAHYYSNVVLGGPAAHDRYFFDACRIVGANPSAVYTDRFERVARKREEWEALEYKSKIKVGRKITHPTFGQGTVTSVENKKISAILTINFGDFGVKNLDEMWLKNNNLLN